MRDFKNLNILNVIKKILFQQGFGWAIFFLLLSSCVSVKLARTEFEKSDDVEFKEPKKPFESFSSEFLDHAWKNKKNGNTISYLSECNNPTDPSLESIHRGIISEIENVQVIEKSETDFNARSAIHSIIEGNVDGIPNRFQLLIFKKNNCTFILTYTALASNFSENQMDFRAFAKGFEVP